MMIGSLHFCARVPAARRWDYDYYSVSGLYMSSDHDFYQQLLFSYQNLQIRSITTATVFNETSQT